MGDSVDVQVQVTQSHFGGYVPQFLLKFHGDVALQNYFRQLLKRNYQRGVVQLGFGHCQACCATLTYNDKPRMKPSQPMTRKVSRILAKSKKQPLGKYHSYLVQKFLRSSTQLTVRCPTCDTVNKRPIITNEAKMEVKEKLLKMSEAVIVPDTSEVTQKKKKRKKKKKKQRDDNSGLIIPGSVNDQKGSDADKTLSASPMDISTLSPLIPEQFSTPLPTKRQISNLTTSAKTSNRSVPAPAYFQKGAFSTPVNRNQSGSGSKVKQTASLKKGGHVQGSKKMKHKHLQEFLSQQSAATVTKPASLADFLSSL